MKPITGDPGKLPVGNAGEIRWENFRLVPHEASRIAHQVDTITLVWLAFSFVVLTLVFGMMIYFCIRFRNREIAVRRLKKKYRDRMEWTWTTALILIALAIGFWSDKVYLTMHIPPPDATPVYVVAKQWMWKIQHEDGTREIDELHVPVGQAVRLIMSSQDVIHSFYLPDFRIKQDVVPGRYSYLWIKPTKTGVYRLFCAEYCGTSHSGMSGKLVVMSPSDYQVWKTTQVSYRAGQSGSDLVGRGRELFTEKGCISCHGTEGKVAPMLPGLYMSRVGLRTGESVIADENYIRDSILNPSKQIVEGYNDIMPPFQGQLSEDDLLSLIAYIKSLHYADRSKP